MTTLAVWPQTVEDEFLVQLEHDAQDYAADLAEQEEEHDDPVEKFNPHHDSRGQFASADSTGPSKIDTTRASAWLRQRWPTPIKVSLAQGDSQTAHDVAATMSALADDFPDAASTLRTISIRSIGNLGMEDPDTVRAVTWYWDRHDIHVTLNSAFYGKGKLDPAILNAAETNGWLNNRPKGMSNAEADLTHEFGHVVMHRLISRGGVGLKAFKQWSKIFPASSSVSAYGREGDEPGSAYPSEHFAECFTAGRFGSKDPQAKAAYILAQRFAA